MRSPLVRQLRNGCESRRFLHVLPFGGKLLEYLEMSCNTSVRSHMLGRALESWQFVSALSTIIGSASGITSTSDMPPRTPDSATYSCNSKKNETREDVNETPNVSTRFNTVLSRDEEDMLVMLLGASLLSGVGH